MKLAVLITIIVLPVRVAVCCSVAQCVLQRVASCCSVSHYVAVFCIDGVACRRCMKSAVLITIICPSGVCCSVLQCVTVCLAVCVAVFVEVSVAVSVAVQHYYHFLWYVWSRADF